MSWHRLWAVLLFLSLACSRKVISPVPARLALPDSLSNLSTFFPVDLRMPLPAAGDWLNKQLPDLLFESDRLEQEMYSVKVVKNGLLTILPDLTGVQMHLPVKLLVVVDMGFLGGKREFKLEAVLQLKLNPSIEGDYEIHCHLSAVTIRWVTRPKVSLGPVEWDASSILEGALAGKMGAFSQSIDQYIQARINIRKIISDELLRLKMPMPVKAEIKDTIWWYFIPEVLYPGGIKSDNSYLSLRLGLKARTAIHIGAKPVGIQKIHLPVIASRDSLPHQTLIPVKASYAYFSALMMEQVKGDTLVFSHNKKHWLFLDSLEFYPSNHSIAARMVFHGTAKGLIYFTAVPFYDHSSKCIRLRNADYRIQTPRKYHQLVNTLVRRRVMKKIESELVFSTAMFNNNALINTVKLSENAQLKTEWKQVVPHKIALSEKQLIVYLDINGATTIQFSGF